MKQILEESEVQFRISDNQIVQDGIKNALGIDGDTTFIREDSYINGITADFTVTIDDEIKAIIECKAGNINVTDYVNSRRECIIKDLLETNNYEHLSDNRKREIKKLFKGYTSMSTGIRQGLGELGFTITEDGKHYKVRYNDDTRFLATISKTASDHRTGENFASIICQKML